jgi:protein-glutamine gamma-glutamyltransferase
MALWSALFPRPAQAPTVNRPSLTLFFLLEGTFLLTLVPHIVTLPFWVTVSVVSALVVRSVMEVYRLPLPSTFFSGSMAIIFAGLVAVQFGGNLLGRNPGTALTAGLLAIKFFELQRPRDVALIIFSCFFVVMSALLYSQVLELFIYCLIMMWVLTALLLRVHTGDLPDDRLLRMLRQSGIIFLQALPLAFFLFFFFPRYHGILSIVLDSPSLGLTDTVSPGSIAKLSKNDDEAMYVSFPQGSSVPLTATMYWRALVLWDYNKGTWTPGNASSLGFSLKVQVPHSPEQIEQEITILQHNQRWLFALDVPSSIPINRAEPFPWAVAYKDNIVQLQAGKLDHRARYTVFSGPVPEQELTPTEEAASSKRSIPADQIDPQVQALADRLHHGFSQDQTWDYVQAVLHYFRHGGFQYDASPGLQGENWLPVFLFKSKVGFCEHFASAFAILMRIEGVPARLVAGYLGAEYNPYADQYTVYQSNAHAWDEVWVDDKNQSTPGHRKGKWVRVDPTALLNVAENGAPANSPDDSGDTLSRQVVSRQQSFADSHLPDWAKESFKEFQLRREEVETSWDNLVFSYDPEVQNRLAQALGFGDRARTELFLLCVAAGGICLLVFRKWVTRKAPVSPLENLYAAFCQKMAQRGIPRASWEGPLAYTERVAEAFPDDKLALQRIGFIVAAARYGPTPVDPATPEHLKSLLTLLTASQAASTSRERR